MFNLQLRGIKKLNRKLLKLEKKMADNIQLKSMRAAMEPVKTAIINKTPVHFGRLRKFMKINVRRSRRSGLFASVVTGTRKQLRIPADDEYYYPAAIEYGTRRTAARPFMRNTFGNMKNQTISIYSRELANHIRAATRGTV